MNKKLLLALTLLSVALAGTALGLWWTVKGKTEDAMKKSAVLTPRFAPKGDFADRMAAIPKVNTKLIETEATAAKQKDELEADARTIEGNNKKIKDLEGNVAELETQRSDLTRQKDELTGKVDNLQAKATTAETKVKELEDQIVKSSEENTKKIEELQAKLDGDKGVALAETQKTRGFYTKLYNFATSHGMNVDMPARPWEDATALSKQAGPHFAMNSLVAEIVAFDTRLGFVVLNVGGDAGLLRDQGFDIFVGEVNVGKLRIGETLNGSVSSGYLMKGTDHSKIAVGTPIKLIPLGAAL